MQGRFVEGRFVGVPNNQTGGELCSHTELLHDFINTVLGFTISVQYLFVFTLIL